MKIFKYSLVALSVVLVLLAMSPIGQFFLWALYGYAFLNSPKENDRLTRDALFRRDIQLCRKVGSGYFMSAANPRGDCLKLLIKNIDVADSICDDPFVKKHLRGGDCYIAVAAKQGHGDSCERLKGYERDNCYGSTARTKKEPSLCQKIERKLERDACFEALAPLGDKKNCLDIQHESTRGSCLGKFVLTKEELPLCAQLDMEASSYCYMEFVKRNPIDLDFCNKYLSKPECFVKASKAQNDPKLCLHIKDANDRAECLSDWAIEKNDMDACELMQPAQEKDNCYQRLERVGAQVLREGARFCKRYSSEEQKMACIRANFDICLKYLEDKNALESCIQDHSRSN